MLTWGPVLALIVNLLIVANYFRQQRKAKQNARSDGHLAIHRATWGPTEDESDDVTERIRGEIHKEKHGDWIDISVENAVLGDKFPRIGKYLTVYYSITKKQVVPEQPMPLRLRLP
jgi:hypothetical protein